MIKNEFSFLSSDNKTNIHAIICTPENGKYHRIFQIIHGMTEYIERYLHFMEYLTLKGFIVVGHDHLGHGQSINTKEDLGYFGEPNPSELLINDIHKLRKITTEKYPNLPYYICGHSMGSYLLRRYICDHSNDLSGVIIIGTGYMSPCETLMSLTFIKILACFKGTRHKSQMIKKMSSDSKAYKRFDSGEKDDINNWLSRDKELVIKNTRDKKSNFDFTLNGYYGLIDTIRYCCNPTNVARVKKDLPILFASGDNDPVGNDGEGVKKSCEIMKLVGSVDVTMKLFEKARHEILNEINKLEVFEYIINWINEKSSSS